MIRILLCLVIVHWLCQVGRERIVRCRSLIAAFGYGADNFILWKRRNTRKMVLLAIYLIYIFKNLFSIQNPPRGAANIPATPREWKSSECWFNGRWGLSCPVFVRRNFSLFRKINTNTFSAASWQIWTGKFALLSFRLFSPEWLTQNEAISSWKPFIYRFHKNESKNLSSFKFCFKCNTSQFYFVSS